MPKRTRLPLVALSTLACLMGACEGSAPPKGEVLKLKGGQDAQCLSPLDCVSLECGLGRCAAKVEKVGLGGPCQGNRHCEDGFYCDTRAKKCAPVVRCEDVRDRLGECIEEVYLAYLPDRKARLRRMKPAERKGFLAKAEKILFDNMCRLTKKNGLVYARALTFVAATQETSCPAFARTLKDAVGK